jgi:hypothetical protein
VAEQQTNGVSRLVLSGNGYGLTPIHSRIHCVATEGTSELEHEVERITIDHFLDTLAEVALAIARRRELLDS